MDRIRQLQETIYQGRLLEKEEIMPLEHAPLEELCRAADEIRRHFCKDRFDLCTIINGKGGKC